jgi:hypothetical protein
MWESKQQNRGVLHVLSVLEITPEAIVTPSTIWNTTVCRSNEMDLEHISRDWEPRNRFKDGDQILSFQRWIKTTRQEPKYPKDIEEWMTTSNRFDLPVSRCYVIDGWWDERSKLLYYYEKDERCQPRLSNLMKFCMVQNSIWATAEIAGNSDSQRTDIETPEERRN